MGQCLEGTLTSQRLSVMLRSPLPVSGRLGHAPHVHAFLRKTPINARLEHGETVTGSLESTPVMAYFTAACPIGYISSAFSLGGWDNELGWNNELGWAD